MLGFAKVEAIRVDQLVDVLDVASLHLEDEVADLDALDRFAAIPHFAGDNGFGGGRIGGHGGHLGQAEVAVTGQHVPEGEEGDRRHEVDGDPRIDHDEPLPGRGGG